MKQLLKELIFYIFIPFLLGMFIGYIGKLVLVNDFNFNIWLTRIITLISFIPIAFGYVYLVRRFFKRGRNK